MRYLFMFFTLAVGGLIPAQAVLNARLGRQIGGPTMGALMSFGIGFCCILLLNLSFNSQAIINLKPATVMPWYIWLGGVLGCTFVAYITFINQRQGVAITFALVVSGQIFSSLLIDHFGLLGSTVRTISLEKVAGAALILSGLYLIQK